MKVKGFIVFAMSFSAHFAFAQDAVLITKTNVTGFTAAEYARTETCEVFVNRVVVTNKFGAFDDNSFTSQEVRRIKLSDSINKALAAAADETLNKSGNYLCDGPSTTINSNRAGKKSVLFSTGGCGSERLERQGGSARMLMDLVSNYCPVTHDLGIQNNRLGE